MEIITYKRIWNHVTSKFVTRCPYRKKLLVGSHSCFFCRHCKGRTENTVQCSFMDFYHPKTFIQAVSMDVMVEGRFVRTIHVKPTGISITDESMLRTVTQADIRKAVEEHCSYILSKNWSVEANI